MVERWLLVSSANEVACHVSSLLPWMTTILALSSLSSRVFRTISVVGLVSSPSILRCRQFMKPLDIKLNLLASEENPDEPIHCRQEVCLPNTSPV